MTGDELFGLALLGLAVGVVLAVIHLACWSSRRSRAWREFRAGVASRKLHFYEWNSPNHLPPVGCPLVLNTPDGVRRAERTSHLVSRERDMEYLLSTGELITGRFPWSYP